MHTATHTPVSTFCERKVTTLINAPPTKTQ